MDGNLFSIGENHEIITYFNNLAVESFKKEQKLYNKIWKDGKPPQNIADLYANFGKIYSLMDEIVDCNNFLKALRRNYFYDNLVTQIISNSGTTRELIGSGTIHDFIQQNIKENAELRDDSTKTRHTINTLRSIIYKLVKTKKEDITYKEIMNIDIENIEVDIEEDSDRNFSGIKIRRRKSKNSRVGLILWDEKDTSNLLKTLEKTFEISFKEEGGFYILDNQEESSTEDQNNTLVDIFINTLKAKFPKAEGAQQMIIWLQANKKRINSRLNQEKDLKNLLVGRKDTMKEVKGDIGELIVNLIIEQALQDNLYENAVNFFGTQLGDKDLGTGKMAVDLALNGIGFQVKNFPSFESKEEVLLYHQSNLLYNGEKVYLKNENGNRYMNKENWETLFLFGVGNRGISIETVLNILKESLPNYLRYSENIVKDLSNNKNLKALSELRSNFYILNFRIIPASIIFSELAKSIKENTKDNILKMFYYTNDDNQDYNSDTMTLTDAGQEKTLKSDKNLFKTGKVYFSFKGIKILKPKKLNELKNLVQF